MSMLRTKEYVNKDNYRQKLNLKPWTLLADFFTGVVERNESNIYDSGILRSWLKGTKKIQFRYSTYENPVGSETCEIEGSDEQMITAMDLRIEMKQYPYNYGMQFLRRRNGTVKITVNEHGLLNTL